MVVAWWEQPIGDIGENGLSNGGVEKLCPESGLLGLLLIRDEEFFAFAEDSVN